MVTERPLVSEAPTLPSLMARPSCVALFVGLAVAAVALGIVVYRLATRPPTLGFTAEERLFAVRPAGAGDPLTVEDCASLRRGLSSVDVACYAWQVAASAPAPDATDDRVALITTDLVDLLGVEPLIGRGFTAADSGSTRPVALLEHDHWKDRLSGDPGVIGRTLTFGDRESVVVGVLPSQALPLPSGEIDVWRPLALPVGDADPGVAIDAEGVGIVARLADGVTVEQARAELDGLDPNGSGAFALEPLVTHVLSRRR